MEEVIYKGKKFVLVRRTRNVGGRAAWGEYLIHPGAVAVLALIDGKAILVKQYRPALGAWTLEIPAGTLEPGESPEEAAIREMVEETGYKPTSLTPLIEFYPTPGVSNEYIRVYLAKGLEHVGVSDRDLEEEDMEVLKIPVREVLKMIETGEVKDGKTIIAFLTALSRGLI